ncbi:MAG: hypothetical protein KGN37_14440 [Burkholderiales bacterium]|nr:hypothetical protein [Burkholderiales bacterium]
MYTTETGATPRLAPVASEPGSIYKKSPPADLPPLSITPDTYVTKTLAPGQPGTRAWSQHHGAALVCVRYRESADGSRRYTTVELVVDERINRRPKPPQLVNVSVDPYDQTIRQKLIAAGGIWDAQQKIWVINRRKARALRLSYTHQNDQI